MSHEELATLWHPPTATVLAEQMQTTEFTELEAPAKFYSGREEGAVIVGRIRFREDCRVIGIGQEDRRRHLYIVGKKAAASYVLHVECSNTLYREAFDFSETSKRIDIPASKLNGTVEVNCFIRAKKELDKYRVEGAHDDYGSTTFEVRDGDILGVAEGQTFEAESQDTLRRIGSIMVIEESPRGDEHPLEVEFSTEKIRIRLCKTDFARYRELKSIPVLASHLTTTIVLPVLTEALHFIAQEEAEFEDLKWYRNLKGRMDDLGLKDDDLLKAAQMLLDMPIRRAFASAAQYATER